MSIVKPAPGAIEAVQAFLAERKSPQPVRIDIYSTGCCDASLGLQLDEIRETDLVQEVAGVTFVMRPELHRLVGDVTVSCAAEPGKEGFVLTSVKPLNEWEGFGVCHIRV